MGNFCVNSACHSPSRPVLLYRVCRKRQAHKNMRAVEQFGRRATLQLFTPLRRRQRPQFAFHIPFASVFLYGEEIPAL